MIGKNGRDISKADADHTLPVQWVRRHSSRSGFGRADPAALAIDMTARNVQDAAKKKGLPWSVAKALTPSAPSGESFSADCASMVVALG